MGFSGGTPHYRRVLDHLIVGTAALCVSVLSLFSGFGLGTLLLPVFALFFPVEAAIAATAIVHGANNVLKVALLGRHAEREIVLRFGVPAVLAAIAGAMLLGAISGGEPMWAYDVGSRRAVITPIKVTMALLMVGFALLELGPRLRRLEFDRRYLIAGGLLSGFFGGLSGHQGALRSAFLAKVRISTQAFVGTNAVIGLAVDLTRIAIYAAIFAAPSGRELLTGPRGGLVLTGIAAAATGLLIASRRVRRVTMRSVQTITGILLLMIALLLGTGLI